jgi:hypothetical protein
MGVSIVTGVVREDQGSVRPVSPACRGGAQEKGVLRVIDIQVQPSNRLPDPRPPGNREDVRVMGRRPETRNAQDGVQIGWCVVVPRGHDGDLVAGTAERLGEGVDGRYQAVGQRSVVIGEEADSHGRRFRHQRSVLSWFVGRTEIRGRLLAPAAAPGHFRVTGVWAMGRPKANFPCM